MVIDSSALAAILLDEPEQHRFDKLIEEDPVRLLSAVSWVEISIVIEGRKGESGVRELGLLLQRAHVEVVPLSLEQAEVAQLAYRRFGKGHHPAKLNFGDCFSYALAKVGREPLLCKGLEFEQTDLVLADKLP